MFCYCIWGEGPGDILPFEGANRRTTTSLVSSRSVLIFLFFDIRSLYLHCSHSQRFRLVRSLGSSPLYYVRVPHSRNFLPSSSSFPFSLSSGITCPFGAYTPYCPAFSSFSLLSRVSTLFIDHLLLLLRIDPNTNLTSSSVPTTEEPPESVPRSFPELYSRNKHFLSLGRTFAATELAHATHVLLAFDWNRTNGDRVNVKYTNRRMKGNRISIRY
ncbi:hypothetical protein BDP27DRAFT_208881 [Rhodocollybia butyracea]|uniref:Uncharacterized protein n=1 Tax=Rhodocollybia butyracea TaxID=206335 RepID=A0A9P5PID5_9AGAR|nr:hypothetical protein BDP27DRAFT_208881 [Rhodocollybia butyracea]